MNRFLTYQTTGALHNEVQSVTLELTTIPALRTEVSSFTSSVDTACRRQIDDNNNASFQGGV